MMHPDYMNHNIRSGQAYRSHRMTLFTAMVVVSGVLTSLSTPGTASTDGDSLSPGGNDGRSTPDNINGSDVTSRPTNKPQISVTNTTEDSSGPADGQTTRSEPGGSPQFRYMIFALSFSITATVVIFVGTVITWRILRKKYGKRSVARNEPDGTLSEEADDSKDMAQADCREDMVQLELGGTQEHIDGNRSIPRTEPDGVVGSNSYRNFDPNPVVPVPKPGRSDWKTDPNPKAPAGLPEPRHSDWKTDEHEYDSLDDGYEHPVDKDARNVLPPLGSSAPVKKFAAQSTYNSSSNSSAYALVIGPKTV